MRSRSKHVVRRTLADGSVKTYVYDRAKRKSQDRLIADSVGALVSAYQMSPEWQHLALASRKVMGVYIRDVLTMGQHAPVKDLKRSDILAARDAIAMRSGNGAANMFLSTASCIMTWAIDHDWIEVSPCHRIKSRRSGSLPAWTPQEADRAEQVLPTHLARAVVLARYTAQRRGDLVRMTWAAYDGRAIQLTQQKTRVSLTIPVHPRLKVALDAWKAEADRGLTILRSPIGLPWQPDHLTDALRDALDAHGFRKRLGIHGLRKLAAAELANAGCSTHEIAAITGHQTLAMVAHYTRSADQAQLAESAVIRLAGKTAGVKDGKRRGKSL